MSDDPIPIAIDFEQMVIRRIETFWESAFIAALHGSASSGEEADITVYRANLIADLASGLYEKRIRGE